MKIIENIVPKFFWVFKKISQFIICSLNEFTMCRHAPRSQVADGSREPLRYKLYRIFAPNYPKRVSYLGKNQNI